MLAYNYKALKSRVTLSKNGPFIDAKIKQFDPDTGEALADKEQRVNAEMLSSEKNRLEKLITDIQDQISNLDLLIEDIDAL
jgi:hypothetical protein